VGYTSSDSPDEQIKAELEKLYPAIFSIAPYMAWRSHDPKAAGEDALHTGIVRMLEMADKFKLIFLAYSPSRKIRYLLKLIRTNALQGERQAWRFDAQILPEKDTNATVHDPAEDVEEDDAYTTMLHLLPQGQREVMELARDGRTANEIAALLGIEPNAVRQRIFRARRKLRKLQRKQDAMS
jgi:RNA polymerase sigma factor (sigma-70 family)